MRKQYSVLPKTEKVVLSEIRKISRGLKERMPGIVFWSNGNAKYEPDEETIYIPSLDWCATYEPDLDAEEYWLLVFHEYAHFLSHAWKGFEGHSPEMYAILTGLVLLTGLPLDSFYHVEAVYRLRSFQRGRQYAGNKLLLAMSKGTGEASGSLL